MQQFLVGTLTQLAERPTMNETRARIEARAQEAQARGEATELSVDEALGFLDEVRAERDNRFS